MKTSDQMKQWIKLEETRDPKPTKTQPDPDGNPTVGWGHKLSVPYQPEYTMDQIEHFFDQDIAAAEAAVHRRISVALAPWQFDALVSFVFNNGEEALAKTIAHDLNAG